MPRRIALVGANGQLAHDLEKAWSERYASDRIIGLTHAEIEVADIDSVHRAIREIQPALVLNTAAYHKVDAVEDHPDRAFAVNASGPRNLALVCRERNAVLVHLSTDYVYSGGKRSPYVETDPVDPINVYGVSKAAGEMLVRYLWDRHFIVRSSGLYGIAGSSGKGGNFVELMLRLAREERAIRVVDDQTLTPTSTRVLAEQLVVLCQTDAYGTYHATCQGQCSWFDFAAEIFRQAGLSPSLSPQTTAESGAKAIRPGYSVLENQALKDLGLDQMNPWQDALARYLAERQAGQS